MRCDNLKVRTLPTGKPYPFNCSDQSVALFFPLLLQECTLTAMSSLLRLVWRRELNSLEIVGREMHALQDSFYFGAVAC